VIKAPIPNLLKFPEVDSAETLEWLCRLNEAAVSDGWRRAVEEVDRSRPHNIRYVTDPARCRFVPLLPLTDQSTVLEIGSSLGQITCALARRAGFVHGLEVVPGQAEFAAERCRQEGFANVALTCGGDDCRLPYADETFDGVVINLVLEWCGARNVASSHLESQKLLLRESARVLKPQGWLFLTTKNRFGLNYLLGKPDEHTFGWRFGQALPRPLLALLLRLRGKSRPPGLIHSYGALRRLLIDAGFGQMQPYWAVGAYRFPSEIVPADCSSIRAARRRRGFRRGTGLINSRLMPLVPAPLVRYVMPGLIFLASKQPHARSRATVE
jgi:SAM-dependent methyltransferase